jgi:hypothetical protein
MSINFFDVTKTVKVKRTNHNTGCLWMDRVTC